MNVPQPGHVVVLDQIVDGERWIGYVLTVRDGNVTAVRCWRGRLDRRIAEHAAEILDSYPTTAHDLERTAVDLANTIGRAPAHRRLDIAGVVARLAELAQLRRQQLEDEARDRQRHQVDQFNQQLDQRRTEWAKNKGRKIGA